MTSTERRLDHLAAAFCILWLTPVHAAATAPSEPPTTVVAAGLRAPSAQRLDALMEEARNAMVDGDFRRAIALYTKILESPDSVHARQAQEFLALARERNGQLAHATAEYRRYLELYPDGADADRVAQRLAGLVTASQPLKEQRHTAPAADSDWDWYGGVSQYYRRDNLTVEDEASRLIYSALQSDADVGVAGTAGTLDVAARMSAGYRSDFLDDGSRSRISSLYVDVADVERGLSARVGRQRRRSGGIPGRIDGAHLAWEWATDSTLNLVTGFPVQSSRDGLETDRQLFGLSADFADVFDSLDLTAFVAEQRAAGLVDRRAVGMEARYVDTHRSLLGLIDYDVMFGEINSVIVSGAWRTPGNVTVTGRFDHRKAPLLTTRNALIGQIGLTLEELEAIYGEDGLEVLATDRTAHNTTLSLGLAVPMGERFSVNTDVTLTDFSGTVASGGVEALPDAGDQLYVSTQLVGSSLFRQGDLAILSFRYYDTDANQTLALQMDTRHPWGNHLRINPRVRVYRRQGGDTEQRFASPSVILRYRWNNRVDVEMEAGSQWTSRQFAGDWEDTLSWFVNLGYRAWFR